MLSHFKNYIDAQNLCCSADRLLLAVSGGVDSVVMAHLFYQAGYSIEIAHCNFALRGEASDGDEALVKKLASAWGATFHSKRFDTLAYAQQHQLSVQMAARELRYEWFEEVRKAKKLAYIATAHHLNDQVETVLFNWVKGTGIAGLRGMPTKNGLVIRPLLFATREEIEAYALAQELVWREDSSNAEDKYRRNFLRNQIIPLLKQINPNLEQTLAQNIEKVHAVETVFNQKVARLRAETIRETEAAAFLQLNYFEVEQEPVILLYSILQTYGFNYIQAQEIWKARDALSGKQFESQDYSLVKDRGQLVITKQALPKQKTRLIEASQGHVEYPFFDLKCTQIEIQADFQWQKDQNMAFLDFEKLQFPLELRAWQAGDVFYPLGLGHRKKVSDLLIDLKIPLSLKEQVAVLCSAGEIIWVVGYRLDDRFKITKETKQVWVLEKIPKATGTNLA